MNIQMFRIEELLAWPEYWQEIIEPELVDGRWYGRDDGLRFRFTGERRDNFYVFDNSVDIYGKIVSPSEIKDNTNTTWIPCECISELRELTPKKIHQTLDFIRKCKGLVEGVKVKHFNGDNYRIDQISGYYPNHVFGKDVFIGNQYEQGKVYSFTLYHSGTWAEKIEEPVLVTEDGYKKYEGDKVWKVNPDFSLHGMRLEPDLYLGPKVYFHEKQNAEKYIEDNKPKYSNKDLDWICNKVKSIIFDAD